MSKLQVLSVFDTKTASFDKPFTMVHAGEGIRQFEHLLKDPNTKFGMNPEDFILTQIAIFDPNNGTFENCSPQIQLVGGAQEKAKPTPKKKKR